MTTFRHTKTATTILIAIGILFCLSSCKKKETAQTEADRSGIAPQASMAPRYDTADRLRLTGSPWIGAADAPVTIVEFSSYQCPFCGRVQPTLKKILEEFPNDVRIVFKQHPLPNQKNAGPAAEAALEAAAQGKFWEFHYKLMDNQRAIAQPDLERYAKELGLDMPRFRTALKDGLHKQKIQSDLATAAAAGIRGTPNFLINGIRLTGAQPYERFVSIIRAERDATRKLLTTGKSIGDAFGERLTKNLTPPSATPTRSREPSAPVDITVGESIAMGNKDAQVTLVEFSDFKCGFCGRLFNSIVEVKDDYKDKVLFVKKQFPLGRWPESEKAAQATLAAHAQGKHDDFARLIYENQRTFDDAMLVEFATQIGLDVNRFKKELEAETWAEQVKRDKADGAAIGVRGTPALYLNGTKIGGALPTQRLREALDNALANTN